MTVDECAEWTCDHVVVHERSKSVGFRCPKCERVAWSLDDLRHGWCDNCKSFTADPHGPAPASVQ